MVFFSFFCCFVLSLISIFIPRAKNGHSKNTKKVQKKGQTSVSAVVFTNKVPILGGGFKNALFAENTMNILVSVCFF